MTEDMPRKLPLYVSREKTRHGKWVYYFRIGKGERLRLPDYGSPEFDAAYRSALTGTPIVRKQAQPALKSLKWLVERYMESAKWAGLSVATRKQQGLFFKAATDKSGDVDYRAITRKDIAKAIDKRKTPLRGGVWLSLIVQERVTATRNSTPTR